MLLTTISLESSSDNLMLVAVLSAVTAQLTQGAQEGAYAAAKARESFIKVEEAGNTEEKDPLEKAVEGVEAFLKGETDKLPEGTQLISDEEALKLAEQASKVAEVKVTEEKTEATEEKAEATEETPKVKTTKATKGRRKKNS